MLLKQDPSLLQDKFTLPENERVKLLSHGLKKANLHYADLNINK